MKFNFNISFNGRGESHESAKRKVEYAIGLATSYEQELVDDILSLMASFSARLYGKRSSRNRKKKEKELSE